MPKPTSKRPPFEILGHTIEAGSRALVNLPVGFFTNNTPVDLTLGVIHGRLPGATLLVTACVHGDEINGAEISRRLLKVTALKKMRGTLLVVPIVNVPAFLNRSRYLPDRRDLNRTFPGSATGSLGSRIARVVTDQLIPRCDAVVDLHTGAVNRPNLPQVRVTAGDKVSFELGLVFRAPVILQAPIRPSSLRSTCFEMHKPIILFESGEALRLDAPSIRHGLQGVLAVMRHLELLPPKRGTPRMTRKNTLTCKKSYWERSPVGGLFTPLLALGRTVEVNDTLGFVADPFGGEETPILAARQGVIIGRTNEGLADEGDALFHIAIFENLEQVRDQMAAANLALPNVGTDIDDHPVPYDPFTEEISHPDES